MRKKSAESVTDRARLRRIPKRAAYDTESVHAILDEGLIAHVGFSVDDQPFVIPMVYARSGDHLLLHGHVKSRILSTLKEGLPACVTVTLVDALVLARSAFHHSINYRSVVAFGTLRPIEEPAEKEAALTALVEHLVPGRSADARGANPCESAITSVLEMTIEEATAKARTGPPVDNKRDLTMEAWAGLIPLAPVPGSPEPAPDLTEGIEAPDYVTNYRRPGA